MSDDRFILPDYYRFVQCREQRWFFKGITASITIVPIAIDYEDTELLYGISKQEVINQCHHLHGCKEGFYLVNLRQKRYYYFGSQPDDVKAMLRSLGIGRDG